MKFQGNHILSVSQFDRDAIAKILQVSAQMTLFENGIQGFNHPNCLRTVNKKM